MEAQFTTFIVVLFTTFSTNYGYTAEFNRVLTGVAFSAYTRTISDSQAKHEDWKSYSLQDVKTMLKVISSKFSKVATFDSGGMNVEYHENFTYYQQSYSQVYSAEAAALINKDENRKLLEIFVGVWLHGFPPQQMDTELNLALESVKKANSIYQGTVLGLIFSQNNIDSDIDQATVALDHLTTTRLKSPELDLKLGTRQNCKVFIEIDKMHFMLRAKLRQIVRHSDFIICVISASAYDFSLGPLIGFQNVKRDLLKIKERLLQINPQIEIMGQTGYSTAISNDRDIKRLKEYWELVDSWATKENYTMWMFEAFDNPWKDWDAFAKHYGWWKLINNRDVGSVDGYIEKVANLSDITRSDRGRTQFPFTTESSNENVQTNNRTIITEIPKESNNHQAWIYAAVSIGVIVVVAIIVQLFILYIRFNKLKKEVLTKDEIQDFLFGNDSSKNINETDQGIGPIEVEALSKPYNKSFEISREHLIIDWETPLGMGQFGSVFKASLRLSQNGEISVALKMTKPNCPKTAVKNLLGEIKILTYLGEHKHLVSIKGAYTAEMNKGVVYIATELCSLGSLQKHLRESHQHSLTNNLNSYTDLCGMQESIEPVRSDSNLEKDTNNSMTANMIRWSYEIACGMEYLAEKQVVHADLATRNVLLTSAKTAKITDFGLSRRVYEYCNYVKAQQEPLPWRWMSIESLKKMEFSSKSDVWSYGVTLWEIFSFGDIPYPGLSWTLNFVSRLENGLRLDCPLHASPKIFKIMSSCWLKEPQERPTFTQLKQDLSSFLDDVKK